MCIRDRFTDVRNPVNELTRRDRHEEGGASLFTGAPLVSGQKGSGISIDQHYSQRVDQDTGLKKPLVAGVWRGFAGGSFRSQTWFRRSWTANGLPVNPMVKPLEIFKLIFGDQSPIEEKRIKLERQKSVLDSVIAQMKSYTGDNSNLPSSHKDFLRDHLEKIRELEKKVNELQNDVLLNCKVPGAAPPLINFSGDGLLPYSEFERVYRLQMDLMALALQCNATRTGSLMFCSAGEDYHHPRIGSTDHATSHYSNEDEQKIYIAYRRFHSQNLRYMMEKLKSAGILDQTAVVFGSEFGDGRTHTPSPQPHLIAGGGGTLNMGRIIDASKGRHTPNDIYATLLSCLGQPTSAFGFADHNVGPVQEMIKA